MSFLEEKYIKIDINNEFDLNENIECNKNENTRYINNENMIPYKTKHDIKKAIKVEPEDTHFELAAETKESNTIFDNFNDFNNIKINQKEAKEIIKNLHTDFIDIKKKRIYDSIQKNILIKGSINEFNKIIPEKIIETVNNNDKMKKEYNPLNEGSYGKVFLHKDKKIVLKLFNNYKEANKEVMIYKTLLDRAVITGHLDLYEKYFLPFKYSLDTQGKNNFMLLEYVPKTLNDFFFSKTFSEKSNAEKENMYIKTSINLLEGLSFLNTIGILHRDIKNNNILYDEEKEQIKIIDLGFGREIGYYMNELAILKEPNLEPIFAYIAYTYCYRDPEVEFGYKRGASAELFSMLMTIYEMIFGSNFLFVNNEGPENALFRKYVKVLGFPTENEINILKKSYENHFKKLSENSYYNYSMSFDNYLKRRYGFINKKEDEKNENIVSSKKKKNRSLKKVIKVIRKNQKNEKKFEKLLENNLKGYSKNFSNIWTNIFLKNITYTSENRYSISKVIEMLRDYEKNMLGCKIIKYTK